MAEQSKQQSPAAAQFATTEHFTLQTARAATISEANGRANLFIGAVSSAVVALAFIGQASEMGAAFYAFALVLFPALFFLGLVTFARVTQSGTEDFIYARAINRLRQYYVAQAPELAGYLLLSTRDDTAGTLGNMGLAPGRAQIFLTASGLLNGINSILAGVFAAVLARAFGVESLWQCGVIGGAAFVVSVALHYRAQRRIWDRVERRLNEMTNKPGRE